MGEIDRVESLIEKYRGFEDCVLIDYRDNHELTDDALLALNQVLSERKIENKASNDCDITENFDEVGNGGNLVTLTKFPTPTEAYVFQGCLESEGISSFVADTNLLQANSFLTTAVGWVRVQVAEDDLAQAEHILVSFQNGEYAIDDDGNLNSSSIRKHDDIDYDVVRKADGWIINKVIKSILKVIFVILAGSIIAGAVNGQLRSLFVF